MIKKRVHIIFFVLLAYFNTEMNAQQKDSITPKDTTYIYGDYIIFKGDTLTVQLDEVHLLKKLKFKTNKDRRYYYWFRRKVHHAYPYAKMTAERLKVIDERLAKIHSKSKKRRYTRRLQKYFENEFTDRLKKLTTTEGRILIKLIYRQTGKTAYDMVKELRNSWKARWYQTTAKLFKLSLKSEYHPESNQEDYLIEDILQRAFNDFTLERQASKLPIDYDLLSSKKQKYIEIVHKPK